jgi:hypothetical protein
MQLASIPRHLSTKSLTGQPEIFPCARLIRARPVMIVNRKIE